MWSSIFWYEELALDIGWTFGDEMSRLGLEVVEGERIRERGYASVAKACEQSIIGS